MKQIVLIQVNTENEEGFFEQTKTSDDTLLILVFWVGVLFFFLGVAVGWILHRQKAAKDRRKRRSHRKSRQIRES